MKSNKLKSLALLLLVVLLATLSGAARDGHREGGPGRREVRAYYQTNVLPVLQLQRQKLETQLAETDRAQLATYRTQLKALKEQGRALRHSLNPGGDVPAARPVITDAQREQVQQLRTQMHEIMQSVAEMARKYDGPITQLRAEVQPQKEKWATDFRAIITKNATPEQQQRMAAHADRMRSHDEPRGPREMHRFLKPAMFLLMDPAAPATGTAERSIGNTSFYPNPASATTQLEYEVKKDGPVTVDLLDKNGKTLRTLFSEPQAEKGTHSQQLNLSDLAAGTYFYKITTKTGSETKRFVKE